MGVPLGTNQKNSGLAKIKSPYSVSDAGSLHKRSDRGVSKNPKSLSNGLGAAMAKESVGFKMSKVGKNSKG
jgi:hypothetical protein